MNRGASAEHAVRRNPDGGRVVVAVERFGGRARIRVRDSGIGIEPAQLQALFRTAVH